MEVQTGADSEACADEPHETENSRAYENEKQEPYPVSGESKNWLEELGLYQDPFGFFIAEEATQEMLQATYVIDDDLERDLLDTRRSVAVLAPPGGGKSMLRLYLDFRGGKREYRRALIVPFTLFEPVAVHLPSVQLNHYAPPLFEAIGEALWQMFKKKPQRLTQIDPPEKQRIWWAFLGTYLTGLPLTLRIDMEAPQLRESYESYGWNRPTLFQAGTSLDRMLSDFSLFLPDIDRDQVVVLVDGIDGQAANARIQMEEIIQPLISNQKLYSETLVWKMFLPEELETAVRRSSAYKGTRLALQKVTWTHDRLAALLRRRLEWASDYTIHSLSNLSTPDWEIEIMDQEKALISQLPDAWQQSLETTPAIDPLFVQLVVRQAREFGPPRTLLLYGRELLSIMTARESLLTPEVWQQFRTTIAAEAEPETRPLVERLPTMNQAELLQFLFEQFSLPELRQLSHNLEIETEPQGNDDDLLSVSMSLTEHCETRNRNQELIAAILRLRPDLE